MEERTTIHQKTLDFLTSSQPNVDLLVKGSSSKSAARDGHKAVSSAISFVSEQGQVPFDRLGLGNIYVEGMQRDETMGLSAIYLKEFPDGIAKFEGTLLKTPLDEAYNQLIDWAKKSPLRRVEFPLEDRIISLMLMHPQSEKTMKMKSHLFMFEQGQAIQLPTLEVSDCLLGFKTDKWINPKNGNHRWLAVPLSGNSTVGNLSFNRAMINCLNGMVTLGRQHFAKQD